MQAIRFQQPDYAACLQALIDRPPFDPQIEKSVAQMLAAIRRDGDRALVEFARQYDHVDLTPAEFAVPQAEIDAAGDALTSTMRKAIRKAHEQVRDFSKQRLPKPWSCAPRRGVILGERFVPLDRVGVYVPGGTAPLISTVLHTVTLAAVAGVKEIVVVTPAAPDKSVHPALLYAAKRAGATEIYRLGGVYGIGALAFGTETVRKVEKIVGPGNAYVTAAKRQVYGYVSLDLVAGPSEIMIIADETANPSFIAADMLSQIEHGSGREQAVLLTTCDDHLAQVADALEQQTVERTRRDTIRKCLDTGVFLIRVRDLGEATDLAGRYAPEHLEIMARRPGSLAKKVTAAGAIFLGPHTPEPVGDFVAGPSHVLPTGGAARFFSGLTVDQFFRRMSVVNYQKSALQREAKIIEAFAEMEGLDAHGQSVAIRCQKQEPTT